MQLQEITLWGRVPRLFPWVTCLILLLPLPAASADRDFEVVSPGRLDFNYPPPPTEGPAEYFRIAENGEARCAIVQPADSSPDAKAAVAAFAQYLKLATGARIRVIDDGDDAPQGLASIHVGNTRIGKSAELDLPDLQYGDKRVPNVRGFLVKTLNPQTLVIRGRNDTATEHGLVGFLKRYVGVRQYWPGEPDGPGDVIPKRPTLAIPQVEWRDWPYCISFQMSMKPFGPNRPQLDFYRRHATLPPGENYDDWLPPSQYAEKHPEYYALVNGERLKPTDSDGAKGWQPCVSNPEVQQRMGETVLQYFREHPEALGINFSINDGGGDCTCEKCRALDAPDTDYSRGLGMSDRYVFLSNRVCEIVSREFPDKWIVYLAYASAARAPTTVKPHSMLLPVLTTPNAFDRWDEWMKAGADHLGHYAHHNDMIAILPKMDVYQHARRIRYAVGSGNARTFYMEAHTQWPYADVVPHVTSELLWDPRQDVDALLDEYFRNFYGPSAEPMRDFYGVLRDGYERWLSTAGTPHWFGRDVSSYHENKVLEQYRVLSPDEADRAAALLQKAAQRARDGAAVRQRIEIISATFALQKWALERGWAGLRLRDEKPRSVEDARRVIEDARLVYDHSLLLQRHIADVLEKPPLDQWRMFRRYAKPLKRYQQMKTGQPGPEVRSTISNGLFAAEEFLRSELGGEQAAAWWGELKEEEDVPTLAAAFAAAQERALAPKAENLVSDPGFEEAAKSLAANQPGKTKDVVLDPEQVREVGVHLTFPDRTPYRCVLTSDEVHSGDCALLLEHCARARLTRHVSAEPGKRYRVGVWFRHNEGAARRYTFAVDARLEGTEYRNLSTLHIPDQPGQWRQYVAEVVAPPEATTIFLRLYAENQAADARCWIDDVFIEE